MPQLSLRLAAISALVPFGARVCDIGTDHGYLAIELMRSKKASSVIAADIGEKPLENARKNIKLSEVEGISLRLCDGLSGINPEEADTVIIAGMGGEVIAGILERDKTVCRRNNVRLLLQPTTSPEALREFLCENGFCILSETPISENGKLYSVMAVEFTGECRSESSGFYYVGRVSTQSEAGKLYIKKQYARCLKCAEALKAIYSKREEYLYYRSVCDQIIDLFGEL